VGLGFFIHHSPLATHYSPFANRQSLFAAVLARREPRPPISFRPASLVPFHLRPLSQFKRDFQNTLTNFKVAAKLRAVKEDGGVGLEVSQTFRRRGADG
jgi:hypothetical protein